MQNALWMVIQREWQDDPKDHVKLLSYTPILGGGELVTTKGQTKQKLGGDVIDCYQHSGDLSWKSLKGLPSLRMERCLFLLMMTG